MDFNIDFSLIRPQKLLLIPQLKQAIEILEMNSQELFCYIENMLEINPVLEAAINSSVIPEMRQDINVNDGTDGEQDGLLYNVPQAVLTMKEHLLIRMGAICRDKCSYSIGEYLIDNIDQNGYLKIDLGEVAENLGVSEEQVLSVLEKLQTLDPPGICARDLRECLLLQLRQLKGADAKVEGDDEIEEVILIVDRYLDEVAGNDVNSVALSTGIPAERVQKLFEKVKELEPRPGREFFDGETERPVVADVIIRETDDGLQVQCNEEAFPDVWISESYPDKIVSEQYHDRISMHDWISDAVWLIKCLNEREELIYSIAQRLCEEEKLFFLKGVKELKPIEKASFAASLNIHESILDKAVKGKYVQCKWGIYEMGNFFEKQYFSKL